jgi:hypothetical protein
MHHQTDVGLVDAHAERTGCHHDLIVSGEELMQNLRASLGGESGVIGCGNPTLPAEPARDPLGEPSGRHVHHRESARLGKQ